MLDRAMGASQEEFLTLPSFQTDHSSISRWRLSDEERAHIASGGDLFLANLTFGGGVQPILPLAVPQEEVLSLVLACEQAVLKGGA
jgi:hypothetical protein